MATPQGQVVKQWVPLSPSKDISIAINQTLHGFVATVHQDFVEEALFHPLQESTHNYVQGFKVLAEGGIDQAIFSPHHRYLYIIQVNRSQLLVLDTTLPKEGSLDGNLEGLPEEELAVNI